MLTLETFIWLARLLNIECKCKYFGDIELYSYKSDWLKWHFNEATTSIELKNDLGIETGLYFLCDDTELNSYLFMK